MIKFCLHLRPSRPLITLCKKINGEISKRSKNEIDFINNSKIIPHITLLSGRTDESFLENNISQMKSRIVEIKSLPEISVISSHLEFVEDSNKNIFTFLCFRENDDLRMLRDYIFNIDQENFLKDLSGHFPHITLAYSNQEIVDHRDILEKELPRKKFKMDKISLSFNNKLGTCQTDALWSIKLP